MDIAAQQEALGRLAASLGHAFAEPRLLELAVTHRSFVNEHPDAAGHSERLEYLGDAVLYLVIAEELMRALPEASEGRLTRARVSLINEASLATAGRRLELGAVLRLGRGDDMNNGRELSSNLADAFEALLGAVYLDGGIEAARRVVLANLGAALQTATRDDQEDPKSVLQVLLQATGNGAPLYRLVGEQGPDHDKLFEVEVARGDEVLARGTGRSKKEAEKDAARAALERLQAAVTTPAKEE